MDALLDLLKATVEFVSVERPDLISQREAQRVKFALEDGELDLGEALLLLASVRATALYLHDLHAYLSRAVAARKLNRMVLAVEGQREQVRFDARRQRVSIKGEGKETFLPSLSDDDVWTLELNLPWIRRRVEVPGLAGGQDDG